MTEFQAWLLVGGVIVSAMATGVYQWWRSDQERIGDYIREQHGLNDEEDTP